MKKRVVSFLVAFVLACSLFLGFAVSDVEGPAHVTAFAATQKTTGLYKSNGVWKYYQNGKFTKATGLAQKGNGTDKTWYYVKSGKMKKTTAIAKKINGGSTKYYVKSGKLNTKTGTVKVGGKTYHLIKGKVVPLAKDVKGKLTQTKQLKEMLTYFAFNARSYDYATEKYSNEFNSGKSAALMDTLLSVTPGYSSANWNLYPVAMPPRYMGDTSKSDPRGLMNHYFVKYPESDVNWIAKNIFNLTQKQLNAYKNSHMADSADLYYEDGAYYHMTGGVGGPFPTTVKITKAWKAGSYYYIKYKMDYGTANQIFTHDLYYNYATLKLKTINGKKYWSLYAHSMKKFKTSKGKAAQFAKP